MVARRGAGRPVDPNSMRSQIKGLAGKEDWITLPAQGRSGSAPEWPLHDCLQVESDLWVRLWSTPQALMWDIHRLEFAVALYVRTYFEASEPKSSAGMRTAALRMEGELGLSMPGMKSLGWQIEEVDSVQGQVVPFARQTVGGDWLKAVTVEGA